MSGTIFPLPQLVCVLLSAPSPVAPGEQDTAASSMHKMKCSLFNNGTEILIIPHERAWLSLPLLHQFKSVSLHNLNHARLT